MKRYFSSIKRYSWIVLVCMVITAVAGALLVKSLPQTYQVNSMLLVNTGAPGNSFAPSISAADGLAQAVNDSSEILSRSVMEYIYSSDPLIKKHRYTADDLLLDITTATSATAATIAVTATANNPGDAVLLANDVAKGYQKYKQIELQAQLDQQRKALQDQYNAYQSQSKALEQQILGINNAADPRVAVLTTDRADVIHNMDAVQAQLVLLPTTVTPSVLVTQLAKVSDISTSSKSTLIIAAAAALGFLIGIVILLIRVFLENRLRSEEEVKEKLGLAYLGGISQDKQIQVSPLQTTGLALQQLTDISANLRLTGVLPGQWHAPQGPILLVTSAQAREGKSTIAAALASTVARSGSTVVVVEGNLHKPATHLAFNVNPAGPGLSGLLRGTGRESVDDVVQRSKVPNVWLLAGGAPIEEAALLLEQKLPAILAQLRKKADLVIIDGPALLSSAEGSVLATMVDGVALVIDNGRDKIPLLLRAKDLLNTLTHTPVGVIMNRLPKVKSNHYYATAYSNSTNAEKWVRVQAYSNGNGNGNGIEVGNGQKPELINGTPIAKMPSAMLPEIPGSPRGYSVSPQRVDSLGTLLEMSQGQPNSSQAPGVPSTPGGHPVSSQRVGSPDQTLLAKEIPAIQMPPSQQFSPLPPAGVPSTPGGRPVSPPKVVPPDLPGAPKDKAMGQQNLPPQAFLQPQPSPRPGSTPWRPDVPPSDQNAKK